MAETWLDNGVLVSLNGSLIDFGDGMGIDYDNIATDTTGIYWYYGDGASARSGSFYVDCYHDGTREILRIVSGATQLGNIYDNAGWRAGSSRKNKKNIREITPQELKTFLELLRNDKVKKYKRKHSPDSDEVGIIAEEGNTFITGGNKHCIAPIKYCGYLHAVIKAMDIEHREKIDSLQTQINELKSKLV